MGGYVRNWEAGASAPGWWPVSAALHLFHFCLGFPSILFVLTLGIFLFRPPEVDFYYADRIALCVLVLCIAFRTLALHQRFATQISISLPLLALALLATLRASRESFDPRNWSLVASKFVVPLVLFHLALLVFRSNVAIRHFKTFALATLGYLIFVSVAFLLDARGLIFPSYIVNEGLGVHVHRARGPLLQAVANGVSLNLLGIVILAFWKQHRKVILVLWVLLPAAILATMTRAVWLSFALSSTIVWRSFRRRCWASTFLIIGMLATVVGVITGLGGSSLQNTISARAEERAPVEIRMAVYRAGWSMFQERPLTGWPAGSMYDELARRMPSYRLRIFYIHNTYLSLLIEFGLPGLLLYGILFLNLFRLRHRKFGQEDENLTKVRRLWPVLLGIYLFNGIFVDMVYQFVNGLVFTMAGILCAQPEETS